MVKGETPKRPYQAKAKIRRSAPARLTIHDVARAAGVSIGTVSKALNKSGALKQSTREHVMETANKLGFRPNDLAQALHRGKSFTVGLISNDSFGRFTMPIMEGLEAVLTEQKIAIFMCNATDDPVREKQHLDQLLGKQIDGLVVTARRSDHIPGIDLGAIDLPLINVFAQSRDPRAFSLLPDDEGGARMATKHLIALGRRRIAHITGPESFEAVQLRHNGYQVALRESGIEPVGDYYQPGAWSECWGREAVYKLLAAKMALPDAILCGNDQIGRGALDALRESGKLVPDEVAVVGFDNWDVMVNSSRPPLTSVDMNLPELGKLAGKYLIRMIRGETFSGVRRLECTLHLRESCGAAKQSSDAFVRENLETK